MIKQLGPRSDAIEQMPQNVASDGSTLFAIRNIMDLFEYADKYGKKLQCC